MHFFPVLPCAAGIVKLELGFRASSSSKDGLLLPVTFFCGCVVRLRMYAIVPTVSISRVTWTQFIVFSSQNCGEQEEGQFPEYPRKEENCRAHRGQVRQPKHSSRPVGMLCTSPEFPACPLVWTDPCGVLSHLRCRGRIAIGPSSACRAAVLYRDAVRGPFAAIMCDSSMYRTQDKVE
ncbi:hypothetical protein EX30DRAFT_249844 [Ascodesmis nigricans]|uniref:Uncharacterized protein n=1 Tax=Ascodesmis nigricans TaxID=341454 RepID=A0A4S2MYB1_9PEZI|nr:hypothetical protein EX30DRAFT_249844 [Ascodesmis nigricans]